MAVRPINDTASRKADPCSFFWIDLLFWEAPNIVSCLLLGNSRFRSVWPLGKLLHKRLERPRIWRHARNNWPRNPSSSIASGALPFSLRRHRRPLAVRGCRPSRQLRFWRSGDLLPSRRAMARCHLRSGVLLRRFRSHRPGLYGPGRELWGGVSIHFQLRMVRLSE